MRITCYVAPAKRNIQRVPSHPLRLVGRRIEEYFGDATHTDNGRVIDLQLSVARSDRGFVDDRVTMTYDWLDTSLQQVLGSPERDGSGVTEVALIYADTWWKDPWTFGLMFDLGFDPQPGPLPASLGRRGAVVFLHSIWKARGSAGDETPYWTEVAFTAIHELGHVFNLWHAGGPHAPSFLTSSMASATFGAEAYHFDTVAQSTTEGGSYLSHNEFLRRCETCEYVQPGGSRFGSRGPLGPDERVTLNSARPDRGLRLRISAARPEFWRFEPVQLDLELSVSRGQPTDVHVPNVLDPAFTAFDLWITEPSGTRRSYRSPIHLCGHAGPRLKLGPTTKLTRDLPVFGQSGGYTFNHAGEHRLQAVLRLGNQRVIASNELCVNILPAAKARSYLQIRDALKHPKAARLLFYGSQPDFRAAAAPLCQLVHSKRRFGARADILYCLSKAVVRLAMRVAETDMDAARADVGAAIDHLQRLTQADDLGPLRRHRAGDLVNEAKTLRSSFAPRRSKRTPFGRAPATRPNGRRTNK